MRKFKNKITKLIITGALVAGVSTSVSSNAFAYTSKAVSGGYKYGPFYQTYSKSTLNSFTCSLNTICKETKRQVIAKYGSTNKKSSYKVSYWQFLQQKHYVSQAGKPVDIKLVN